MKMLFLAFFFLLSAVSVSAAGDITVEVAAVATSIENLIPVGVAEKFSASAGKLYCYSKIIGGKGQNIKHLWYLNDKKIGETTLSIKSWSYRTYSVGTMPSHMKGNGRCDVVTEGGNVLKRVDFLIE